MNYYEYLQSELWGKRRYAALERADFKCELCGEIDSLEVHHRTYDRLGDEDPSDLIVICKSHHWEEHVPKDVVVHVPSKAKECAYVIGTNRKISKLMDLYTAMGTIGEREEMRVEIDELEKLLNKHYKRGNCSVCPPLKKKRLSKKERKVMRMKFNKMRRR